MNSIHYICITEQADEKLGPVLLSLTPFGQNCGFHLVKIVGSIWSNFKVLHGHADDIDVSYGGLGLNSWIDIESLCVCVCVCVCVLWKYTLLRSTLGFIITALVVDDLRLAVCVVRQYSQVVMASA